MGLWERGVNSYVILMSFALRGSIYHGVYQTVPFIVKLFDLVCLRQVT